MSTVREVPDPAAFGFKAPKWQAALKEYQRLQRQRTDALAEQGHLRGQLQEAQTVDTHAHAKAIRAGKPDPGNPASDAIKSQQESVQRRVDALTVAVEQARRELLAAVEQEKAAVLAEVGTAEANARAALQAAVDAWGESRTRHTEIVALREFLSAFPDIRFKLGRGYLRNQPQRGDGTPPLSIAQVTDMLRRDAELTEERVVPPNVQPLQPTLREIGVSGTPLR